VFSSIQNILETACAIISIESDPFNFEFKRISNVIVANRLSDDISDIENKVVTRDLFGNDS